MAGARRSRRHLETCNVSSLWSDHRRVGRPPARPQKGDLVPMEGSDLDQGIQRSLQARLDVVDEEIADLRSLLVFMRRIERDAALRERLREVDLGFRWQDLWAGRITGEPL